MTVGSVFLGVNEWKQMFVLIQDEASAAADHVIGGFRLGVLLLWFLCMEIQFT